MVAVKSLLTVIFAGGALAQTVPQVEAEITTLDNDVKSLITAVQAYDGGLVSAAPQLTALTAVYGALFTLTIGSALLPPTLLSDDDAQAIVTLVNTTLAVDNPIAVKTLESKKALYKAQGLDGLLVGALELLKAGHESVSANLLERIPSDKYAAANEVVLVIDQALQDGIDYFTAP